MPNILEQYFEEASNRIPTDPIHADKDLPRPEYPEHESFNPIHSNDDFLLPVQDKWTAIGSVWRLGVQQTPFPISSDDRALLDGGIRKVGLEAYAFYKSLRYVANRPYPGKWGIFYLDKGVARVQELIEATYPGYGSSLVLAYKFLREHERFHFKFDLYALSAEAKLRQSLYEPLKRSFRNHQIYQVEEALSNHYAWKWAKQKRIGLSEFAYDFMKLQPGAYTRFDENKTELAGELAANLLDLNLSRMARREDQAFWVGHVPEELLRSSLCPEYFVQPAKNDLTTWISPTWKLPEVRNVIESQKFSKMLDPSWKKGWENTKRKLVENPAMQGLNFKPWPRIPGYWSVRINDNFRAHLHPVTQAPGTWEADELGTHDDMKH